VAHSLDQLFHFDWRAAPVFPRLVDVNVRKETS